jgi:hypothetical protein
MNTNNWPAIDNDFFIKYLKRGVRYLGYFAVYSSSGVFHGIEYLASLVHNYGEQLAAKIKPRPTVTVKENGSSTNDRQCGTGFPEDSEVSSSDDIAPSPVTESQSVTDEEQQLSTVDKVLRDEVTRVSYKDVHTNDVDACEEPSLGELIESEIMNQKHP